MALRKEGRSLAVYVVACSRRSDRGDSAKRCEQKETTRVLACVAWRFWLGALSNKGGRGQRNREEIGASPLILARFASEFRGLAARAPG